MILEVATNALDVDCSIVCEEVDEAGDEVDGQDSGGGVVGGWERRDASLWPISQNLVPAHRVAISESPRDSI